MKRILSIIFFLSIVQLITAAPSAVYYNDPQSMKPLLKKKYKKITWPSLYQSPLDEKLFQACLAGNFAKAHILIKQGADVNAASIHPLGPITDINTLTSDFGAGLLPIKYPLHAAIDAGSVETIQLLIEYGADLNINPTKQ